VPLILGGNNRVYLQKGKTKLYVNSIYEENCMILKNFSLGKQPYKAPAIEGKEGWTEFLCLF
jgi:hypothetical protein